MAFDAGQTWGSRARRVVSKHGHDPDQPRTQPSQYVRDIGRLAAATSAFVVHTNWPNGLKRPEESADGGGSTVASPRGEVLFRLPMQEAGIAVFDLGARAFQWHAEPAE